MKSLQRPQLFRPVSFQTRAWRCGWCFCWRLTRSGAVWPVRLRNRYRACWPRRQRRRHARGRGNGCHALALEQRCVRGRGRNQKSRFCRRATSCGARFDLDRSGLGRGRFGCGRAVATRGGLWPRRAGLRAAARGPFGARFAATPRAAGFPDLIIPTSTQENPFCPLVFSLSRCFLLQPRAPERNRPSCQTPLPPPLPIPPFPNPQSRLTI